VHALILVQYSADPFATSYISDALSYHEWGQRLERHGVDAEPVFHQAPLFPVLIGTVYAASDDPTIRRWSMACIQLLMSSLAVALLVPLGYYTFGRREVGMLAAALALLHGPIAFHSLKLLPVTLALLTQGGALLLLLYARRRPAVGPTLAAGVAWGLACLTRSEMLLFLPLGLVALAWPDTGTVDRGRRFARLAAFGCAALLTLLPATLHNRSQGDLVLISASAGENLFIGNQRGADGGHRALDPSAGDIFSQRVFARQQAEAHSGSSLRPSEISAYWTRRTIDEVVAAPAEWIKLEALKLGRLLHPGDPSDMYSLPLERREYLWALYLLPVPAGAIWLLALYGAPVAFRRHAGSSWPVFALIGVGIVTLLVFFVSTRLRIPLIYLLCLPAAAGLREIYRSDRRRPLAMLLLLSVLALTVWNLAWSRPTVRETIRLASVLSMQQRMDEGLEVLGPELDSEQPDAAVLDQAGWLHFKRGDWEPSVDFYERALAHDLAPERVAQTRTRLAWSYERLNRIRAAGEQHDLAVNDPHASPGTFHERGMFRVRNGDRAGGIHDLTRAAEMSDSYRAPREALRELGVSIR